MLPIVDTAVKKRISVVVLSIVIFIFGLISYYSMPRESTPDITIPYIYVMTSYPGVAPVDIEQSVTIPIENKLRGLKGVKEISSSSVEGISSIVIEFVAGTDIDDVLPKTKDKVDMARQELPSDLENDPVVSEINISDMPILTLSISGPAGMVRLKEIADDLEEEIESIPGVLAATVTGGLEREIRVEPYPDKLAYYGISIVGLQSVIANENINVSGGSIRMGDGRFQLRVPGEFETPDEIYGLVVETHNGNPVYLKDVAEVVDGFKDEAGRARLNGEEAISVSVQKRSGENIIEIVEQVDEILERSKPQWPAGTKVTKLLDYAEEINDMVLELENHIITGLFLVVIVLFFAMGIRNAILVSLAIPFSMFISFIILDAMGVTLNMIVLFSLTLALGLLVDDAIVIVENIYRFMEQGVPRLQATVKAAVEVGPAVIASTLTTLAAFFPLLFWPGIMGEFMKYLPLTVIVTLSSSLFVAIVINPALGAIFMKLPATKHFDVSAESEEDIKRAAEAPAVVKSPMLKAYQKILIGALNHRIAVAAIAFLVVIFSIMLWYFRVGMTKSIEFFPYTEPSKYYINLDMPEGADIEYSDRVVRQIEIAMSRGADYGLASPDERPIDFYYQDKDNNAHKGSDGQKTATPLDITDIEYVFSNAVATEGSESAFSSNSPNYLGVQFYDMEDRKAPSYESMEEIRKRIKDIPGALVTIGEEEMGPPTGDAINIEISGDDLDVLGEIAKEVRNALEKIPFVQDINDDYISGSPTVKVEIDRQKAAILGLSTNDIGFALKVAFNGLKVSTYREGDEDYDITVQLSEEDRKKTDILRELMITTPTGIVPLSTVAKFTVTGGLAQVMRIDHERVVTVTASVDETKVPGATVRAQAQKLLEGYSLPAGYKISFTGEEDMQAEAQEFLSKAFLIGLFLIIIILVAEFNSVSQPILIMTSVILSWGGVFFGLTIMGYSFGVIMTGVGIISLAGVVVKNAIVLIDYINRLIERGMPVREAIIAGGCTRLRPVLFTAITAILGLIPMVTGISYDFHEMELKTVSESTQFWSNMGISVIFGLALSTMLTLLVVPTLYSLLHDTGNAFGRGVKAVKKAYWAPFYRITGTAPEEKE
ncbi:MAG: efflux RND transporter permease subunit [Deltaproteobacteria bacterium]|nr:efflux RND transporter permease subunit [Deltaproteobacteria bacterium]